MPVSGFEIDDIDPSALARPPGALGDRLLPVERSDSFDQRFEGLAVWDTDPAMIGEREESAGTARQPSRKKATEQSAVSPSAPNPRWTEGQRHGFFAPALWCMEPKSRPVPSGGIFQ
jgi:hypothetical protein